MHSVDKIFERAMVKFGSFEPHPHVAVAFSGGGDSTALLHLLVNWINRCDGKVTALVVDHGLRDGSAKDAGLARDHAIKAGVTCHVLNWRGPKPTSAIQASARKVRYQLLGDWCLRNGVLHLALGHQLDDQMETVCMRASRGSGPDGLAGMTEQRETEWGRIVRPLLSVNRSKLRHFLKKRNISWINDPSNDDHTFERVRVRQEIKKRKYFSHDLNARRTSRKSLDYEAAKFLAVGAMISPFGYAMICLDIFNDLSVDGKRRVISGLCATIGGLEYNPRRKSIDAVVDSINKREFVSRTLGGCIFLKVTDDILIVREAERCPVEGFLGKNIQIWDRRFVFSKTSVSAGISVGPLILAKSEIFGEIRRSYPNIRNVPEVALRALPAFFKADKLLAVPHLRYGRSSRYGRLSRAQVVFRPKRSASNAPFTVVK